MLNFGNHFQSVPVTKSPLNKVPNKNISFIFVEASVIAVVVDPGVPIQRSVTQSKKLICHGGYAGRTLHA